MRNTTFVEGVVMDTNDPQQMGRVKVWCPGIDGQDSDPLRLPWTIYVSPFAGQAIDYVAGTDAEKTSGPHSYGFWAIPKRGATVIVGFLYGDFNNRFYLGSIFPDHGNRSLPTGRNSAKGPISDTEEPVQPAAGNLHAQFGGDLMVSEAQTRGAFERMVAQPSTVKDGAEDYKEDVIIKKQLDPQTYCITTPGHHSIIMQDHPTNGRVRVKTAEGHQVILDDANERIYVSTAKGRSWLELDQDGHIHVYAAESVSVTSGADINLTAKASVNIHAGENINLAAGGWVRGSACADVSLSGDGGVAITSGAGFDILAAANLIQTGAQIHLNGPGAKAAACASKTEIVPQHEPWIRPPSNGPRNKNWKA